MEVVIEGPLDKCLSSNAIEGKREWKRRHFVLKKSLGSGTRILEYYKEYNWRRLEPKGVLTLFSGFSLNIVPDSKKKFAFEIKTVDNTFLVAAPSDDCRKRWMGALQEESGVKSFVVKPDENAKLRALAEMRDQECSLQIAPQQVMLVSDSCILVSWPLSCIRRYRCKNAMFMLEVGHKAPTGEGLFRFFTHQGQQIFETLDMAVKDRMTTRKYRSVSENDSGEISAGLVSTVETDKENTIPRMVKKFPQTPQPDHPRSMSQTPALQEDNQYSHLGFSSAAPVPQSRITPGLVNSQSYDHITTSPALPPDVITSARHGMHRGSDSALIGLGQRTDPIRPQFHPSQSYSGSSTSNHLNSNVPIDTVGYSNLKFDPSAKPGNFPSNMQMGRRQSDALEGYRSPSGIRSIPKSSSADQLSGDAIYDKLNEAQNHRIQSGRPSISSSPQPNLYDNLNHLNSQQQDNSPTVISFWKGEQTPSAKATQRQGAAYQTTTLLNKEGDYYDSLNHHPSSPVKPFPPANQSQQSHYDTPRLSPSQEPIYQNTGASEEPKTVTPQMFNFKDPHTAKPPKVSNPVPMPKPKVIPPAAGKVAPGVAPKPKPSGQDAGALVAQLKKNLQIKGFNPVKPPREGQPEPIPSPTSKPNNSFGDNYSEVGAIVSGEYGNIGFGEEDYATVGEVFVPTDRDNVYSDIRS